MKPPKQVVVGPITYRVKVVQRVSNTESLLGVTHKLEKDEIRVARNQGHERMRETLVHELLHALWDQAQLAEKDEEKIVRRLHGPLLALLRGNPELVEWLLS